jgi:hypothetical protein
MSSDKDRFENIILEMKSLVAEAIYLVPPEERDRARSYWYAHIVTSLDEDHEYAAGSMCSMQNTLDEWEDESYCHTDSSIDGVYIEPVYPDPDEEEV